MHHPYTAEIPSSCCLDVEHALLATEVVLLSEYGTLLSLTLPWSHKNFQEEFPVQQEFSFFAPAFWLCFFNRACTCRYLHKWRLSLISVIPFWGEAYDHGWWPGFGPMRSSCILTKLLQPPWCDCSVPNLLYDRTGAESVFWSAQCSARTVLSVFVCWVLTGVQDDLVWDTAVPALALSSLWCHSHSAGRSQLAMSQLLRHPLRGKVSLGELKLMKSYPQENISKTDGPIRQKNKTRIEERKARKKVWWSGNSWNI